jgi:broad specificity phosphatase PhoE
MSHESRSEIWLVRHGQSESNANFPTVAPQSSGLTEEGLREASRLAATVNKRPDLIIVSPYDRSIQTARPLIEKYPNSPVTEWPVQEFTYLPPLAYQGTTAAERRPEVNRYWLGNDPHLRQPGAESFVNFTARITESLTRLRRLEGFTVLISHGHAIRLLWQLLASGPASTPEQQMRTYNLLRLAVIVPNCATLKLRFGCTGETWMSGFIELP